MEVRRFFIRGRTQGVGFRAAARERARRHSIRGFARNLPDGRVEVLAIGEASGLSHLEDWLHRGPIFARVDEVVHHTETPSSELLEAHPGFVCR